MQKRKIGLVFGGKSPEHEISIISARNIYNAINKEKFEVILIGIAQDGKWYLEDALNLQDEKCVIGKSGMQLAVVFGNEQHKLIRLDNQQYISDVEAVFPITHGPNGEDGTLQGIFLQLDIPFVGPSVLGSAVAMDKDFTKRILRDAGIGHAKGITIYKHQIDNISYDAIVAELGNTLYIKPCNMGSSVGVSKATNEADFKKSIAEAFKFDHKVLVEKAIIGRELECAVLGNEIIETSTVGEIVLEKGFYDFENKYKNDNAKIYIPAPNISAVQLEKIQSTARDAYQALGLEGLSRVDVFLTDNDEVIINEPNTLPGFTSISMYPKLWESSGLKYTDLIEKLIELSIERATREKQLQRVRLV
ncbi:MAG TPA: D-alanine--D-alanine ligase [Chitinophagales bacterium]|nr:D-alanine--D-alanine ligase [Chitinophagales bacterium]HMY23395.1 D-alanine--D-alanine ligase [Chitinophagales bacterium]HMZ32600.1 D-alanine--D-alanine ligase [Chitinophagales bacterium]HNA38852.1 D-alanine--D-alanine ligase [Chitinophagales bacterium]HNC71120.1 D-alanine--D-alanine ligase [Chitinophagales bacterium]